MGTRAQIARKYQAGAHLARIAHRPGWFIRWVVPRHHTFVVQYTPARTDAPHAVLHDQSNDACRLSAAPPANHPLHGQLAPGDIITHAGEHRVHDPAQLANALRQYNGLKTGLRVRRGKPGNAHKLKKAGDTYEQAEVALAQFIMNRKREEAGQPPIEAPATYTFGQLALELNSWAHSPLSGYSKDTLNSFACILAMQVRLWGAMPLTHITPALLGRWAVERTAKVCGGTFVNDIKVLRAAFRLAMQRHYCDSDPSAGLKLPKQRAARPKYLTDEQIAVLLECAREHDVRRIADNLFPDTATAMRKWYNADGTFDVARVRFMLLTALRKSQLTSLRWVDYDQARGTLVLESRPDHSEKSKRVTVLPLPRQARTIINGQPQGTEYIFPNLQGQRDISITNRMVRIFEAVKVRGAGHVHLHMLRHTALTALLRHSHDIASVQRFAGHSDVKTTARYAWVLDSDLKATVEDFNPMKPAGDPGAVKK